MPGPANRAHTRTHTHSSCLRQLTENDSNRMSHMTQSLAPCFPPLLSLHLRAVWTDPRSKTVNALLLPSLHTISIRQQFQLESLLSLTASLLSSFPASPATSPSLQKLSQTILSFKQIRVWKAVACSQFLSPPAPAFFPSPVQWSWQELHVHRKQTRGLAELLTKGMKQAGEEKIEEGGTWKGFTAF